MKKKRKEVDYETLLKRFVVASLRKSSLYWPPRNEALKHSRIERGMYQCNICKKAFGRKEVQIDHKNPVVKLSGFKDWDEYIRRMLCDASGYQIICKPCHSNKTSEEMIIRKIKRKLDKNK